MYELNPLECALNEAQAYRNQVDALSAENAKLWEALTAALIRVSAANEETGRYMDEDFCDILRKLGIEVDA